MFSFLKNLFRSKPTVLVIVGPTASGKSSLAIELAQQYDGEVLSCDSRQIYSGLEIFSGAVTSETSAGVKHHLISFVKPGVTYSANDFVRSATTILDQLHKQNRLPIIAGGTGFWAQALMYPYGYPPVPPNPTFRETYVNHTTEELFELVKQQDPTRADTLDPHNRRRILRALEIIDVLGAVPPQNNVSHKKYRFVFVYIEPSKEELDKRITNNVSQRLEQGLIAEAETIVSQLSRTQCEELGLGYKYVYDLVSGKITKEEFVKHMVTEEIRYAKRQKTFLNKLYKKYRGPKLHITSLNQQERVSLITRYLSK